MWSTDRDCDILKSFPDIDKVIGTSVENDMGFDKGGDFA